MRIFNDGLVEQIRDAFEQLHLPFVIYDDYMLYKID